MIIKVPIYLEVDKLEQDMIPSIVNDMGNIVYSILRKEKELNGTFPMYKRKGKTISASFKVLSKEKALEYLRTSK